MNRRLFLKLLLAASALPGRTKLLAANSDPGLEREASQLLQKELLIDTASSDRFFRYPAEGPLNFDPTSILPVTGAAMLGIAPLLEQMPTFFPEGSKLLHQDSLSRNSRWFCLPALRGAAAPEHILGEFEATFRAVEAHAKNAAIALTPDDIVACHRAGKLALVLGLDSAFEINSDIDVLDEFYRIGLRKLALTHEIQPPWAESTTGDTGAGLRPFGREVIAECNRRGIMIDISHSSDQTFWDALKYSTRPIIATHSGARRVTPIPRNMTDEMILALAKSGGMLGVGPLLSAQKEIAAKIAAGYPEANLKVSLWMQNKYRDPEELAAAWHNPKKHIEAQRALGLPDVLPGANITFFDIDGMTEQLGYLIKLVGFDHVGIGTDLVMNWPIYPTVMRGAAAWMLKQKYTEEQIRKVLSKNFLRVFRDNTVGV